MTNLQASLGSQWPQLREVLQQQGAAEFVRDVASQLMQRFTARVIKFVFGSQDARAAVTAGQPNIR